ncbi:hypothetical protein ACSBM8_12245 [Sphingomonas sp. ASY06-1R]|uniref:hypothetical protein n=1 Tax=Sphingomonas sp. ASY06-1R TaxID=3445771 RepID=UPI003FA20760
MSDSSNVVPLVKARMTDFMKHPEFAEVADCRFVWFTVRHGGRKVDVLVSWDAQCAVARSTEMTTDEIFRKHARDFDQQIAILMASLSPSPTGVWTLDASDVVPVI